MARPRTAKLQTAYDLGHEHGRTGSRPRNADDIIGDDPDMQQAYDDGLADGTDSLDTGPEPPPAAPKTPRPRAHRTNPASGRRKGSPSGAPAAAGRSGSTRRFSHPLHWGSGARGQVVGRPTLRPPSGVSLQDWTGFGMGLFLYALASAYIESGPGGPTSWLKAKFINDVTATTPATTGATTTQPSSGAGGGGRALARP